MTLDNETGQMNLIVWQHVAQRYRSVFLQSQLLEVQGKPQHDGDVMHVVAEKLVNRSSWLGGLRVEARDFHSCRWRTSDSGQNRRQLMDHRRGVRDDRRSPQQ